MKDKKSKQVKTYIGQRPWLRCRVVHGREGSQQKWVLEKKGNLDIAGNEKVNRTVLFLACSRLTLLHIL